MVVDHNGGETRSYLENWEELDIEERSEIWHDLDAGLKDFVKDKETNESWEEWAYSSEEWNSKSLEERRNEWEEKPGFEQEYLKESDNHATAGLELYEGGNTEETLKTGAGTTYSNMVGDSGTQMVTLDISYNAGMEVANTLYATGETSGMAAGALISTATAATALGGETFLATALDEEGSTAGNIKMTGEALYNKISD